MAARVGIVGLGHIGGSLALALEAASVDVVATSRSDATRAAAGADGVSVVDTVGEVVEGSDVVVVAAALDVLGDVLVEVLGAAGRAPAPPTVTDAGSVKVPLVDRVRRDSPHAHLYVPGHPMAGNEGSGWASAVADLFRGRTWALDPIGVDLSRWAAVARVALAAGATVVPAAAAEHDEAVALTSHLPYALAALASGAVGEADHPGLLRALAAGSFDSLTRVAAGHDTLGAEMALGNAAALAPRLRSLAGRLDALADALGSDADGVRRAFDAGRLQREALLAAAAADVTPLEVDLDADGLLALGRRGGRVVEVLDADAGSVRIRALDPEGRR